jgi:hypothetical protein
MAELDQEEAVIEGEKAEAKETVKETPKPTREDYDRLQREKASKDGWTDFDAWVEAGHDPADWRDAQAYNEFLSFKGTLTRKTQEFNQRLEGVQRLSEAQLAAQRSQLEAERDALIEEGGKNKEVKAIDRQIQATYVPVAPQVDATLDQWNAENQWINEKTPKAIYARTVWSELLAANTPIPQALEKLEADIKKHYPPVTHKPATVPDSERGSGPKGFNKGSSKAATMDSLTAEERKIWGHSAHMWKGDEKRFLQSVTDSRNAAKGGN